LLWSAIIIRLVTFYVNIEFLLNPAYFIWENVAPRVKEFTPKRLQFPLSGLFVAVVVLVGAMATPEYEDNTRLNRTVSLAGFAIFILLLWGSSRNRKFVDWHTVIVGVLMQFLTALFVLRTQAGFDIFNFISQLCRHLFDFADIGLAFLSSASTPNLGWLVISIVPPIIFFAGIAQLLSYW
jgi:CNT family concentrative nucleoside transporter